MSIGRVGKQAKDNAQQHQQRHQMNYSPLSNTVVLKPPQRKQTSASPEDLSVVESVVEVQRTIALPNDETIAPDVAMPEVVQRVENQSAEGGATNNDQSLSAKAVADRVYALLIRDVKREQERLGTFGKLR